MANARIGDDADFKSLPPGCIPASRSGVYRQDHFDHRGAVYTVSMQQQQQVHPEHVARQQQMR